MSGLPFDFIAEIAIPDAGQCLTWAAPVLAVVAMIGVLGRMDQIIDRLFPHWEWERRLGWLNIRAIRRAEKVLRWLGYFIYAVLGLALLGIVWSAQGLVETLNHWDNPHVAVELALRVPVLLASLGFWLVYLGCELLPKLRGQYEEEELQKFRAEQAELEREREQNPVSRVKTPLHQPRINPKTPTVPNRSRLR